MTHRKRLFAWLRPWRVVRATLTLALALGALMPNNASADSFYGHISSYYLSNSNNLPFRIYLDTTNSSCPDSLYYVDMSNTNYQAYVSGLLEAFALQKQVNLSYITGSGGYCQITEYQVLR